jgi:hypothetical protein
MDDQTLLDAVNAQILALTTGGIAEWQEGSHRVRHCSLRELLDMKRELENAIASAAAGGIIVVPITSTRDS